MDLAAWTLDIACRRNIRSRRDLVRHVVRMSLYISTMTAAASGIVSLLNGHEHGSWSDTLLTVGATFTVSCVFSLPITWEFGRMYLDLWQATQSLHTLARTDQHTGLLNHRTFIRQIEERLAGGRRMVLLLGDLDRFKSINDRFGHPKGDEVIEAVGTAMRDLFCASAIVGRIGGEEFAVAIDAPFAEVGEGLRHGRGFAEELRRRIAAVRIDAESGVITPTISIGVALSAVNGSFSDLYARADKALYIAKAAGRDRVADETALEFADRRATRAHAEPKTAAVAV